MSKKILVIGNGFDLAHGRKTKYDNFLEWICKPEKNFAMKHPDLLACNKFPEYEKSSLMTYLINCYNNKRVSTWIDLELEIKNFIQKVDSLIDFLNEREYVTSDSVFYIRARSVNISYAFLINQLVSFFDSTPPDVVLKKEYIDIWWKIDKKKIFETIQKELTQICKMFEFYLIEVEPNLRGKINIRKDISDIDPTYVISFNYTDTIQEVYGVKSDDICYIHGKIKENNIVLGYDDSDGNTSDLQFKKYYQRLIKDTDRIDYSRFYEINEIGFTVYPDIYFYGHSLDVSDIDILSRLFSRPNKIYIFFRDNEDKNLKIKNIISIVGKKQAEERIGNNIILFH